MHGVVPVGDGGVSIRVSGVVQGSAPLSCASASNLLFARAQFMGLAERARGAVALDSPSAAAACPPLGGSLRCPFSPVASYARTAPACGWHVRCCSLGMRQ